MSSANEVFDRLESAIDAWNDELNTVYGRLTERINQARDRIHEHSAERQLLAEAGDVLEDSRAQLQEVKAAAEACAQAARDAAAQAQAAQDAVESLRHELRELASQPAVPAVDEERLSRLRAEILEAMPPSAAVVDEERLSRFRSEILESIPASPEIPTQDIERLERAMDDVREELNRLGDQPAVPVWDANMLEALKADLGVGVPAGNSAELPLQELRKEVHDLQELLSSAMLSGMDVLRAEVREIRGSMASQFEEVRQSMEMTALPVEPDGLDDLGRELARLRVEVERLKSQGVPVSRFDDLPEDDSEPLTAREVPRRGLDPHHIEALWPDGTRKRLGEILLGASLVTQEQMDAALSVQKQDPQQRLGNILVSMGYAKADEIAQVLSYQLKVPFIRLDIEHPHDDAVSLISSRLARHHHCMPVKCNDDELTLAMANPLDLIAIEDVELAAKRRVEPVIASTEAISKALDKHYPTYV
ncbi:MAG: hypothetical protein AMXMBFR84_23460 [Candidatus Hydrogenedentota bacterium]